MGSVWAQDGTHNGPRLRTLRVSKWTPVGPIWAQNGSHIGGHIVAYVGPYLGARTGLLMGQISNKHLQKDAGMPYTQHVNTFARLPFFHWAARP